MGYDVNMFLNPVHHELICSICMCVFEQPIYLPLCRHVFCSSCISTWLNSPGREMNCPIDKTSIKLAKEKLLKNKVSLALNNIISESIVYCKYKDSGCQDTFSLTAYLDHIKKCEFKEKPGTSQNNSTAEANQISNQMILENSANKSTNKSSDLSLNRSKSDNLCRMEHPKKNEHVYFNTNFKLKENCKIIKLEFKNISLSYKPFTLASYIKQVINVDVHCVHANLKKRKDSDSTRDLYVFVSDDDCDKVMRNELWPQRITIEKRSSFKRIIITGSLKTARSEKFFGSNARDKTDEKRKNLRKQKRAAYKKRKEEAKKSMEKSDLSNATDQINDSKEKDSDQTEIPQPGA